VLTTCPELLPGWESNSGPLDLESDTLTTTSPSHPGLRPVFKYMSECQGSEVRVLINAGGVY